MKSSGIGKALGGVSALLLVTAGAIAAGPLTLEASAQVFSSQRSQGAQNGQVGTETAQTNQGTVSLQTTIEHAETLYLDKNGTYDYDLVLSSASSLGGQRLPIGTIIRGQFQPAEGGLVYIANSVELSDRIYQINAYSDLLRDVKDPRETSTGAILTDAAIGAAGGYVLGEVFGDPDVLEVLGGAAAGVVIGNTTAPFVVVINPDDPITLYAN